MEALENIVILFTLSTFGLCSTIIVKPLLKNYLARFLPYGSRIAPQIVQIFHLHIQPIDQCPYTLPCTGSLFWKQECNLCSKPPPLWTDADRRVSPIAPAALNGQRLAAEFEQLRDA